MSEDQKFFYANGLELQASGFDITMKFLRVGSPTVLQQSPTAPGAASLTGKPEIIDHMAVYMSPTHAKSILLSLLLGLEAFEQNSGTKIQMHPQVETALKDALSKYSQ